MKHWIHAIALSTLCTALFATTPEEYGLQAISENFCPEPVSLLTPSRFDITAKYLYAKYKEKNIRCIWALRVYGNHLAAINGLIETSPYKKGLQAFVNSFNQTLDSIKKNQFDPKQSVIPVDANGNARDGSHRVASCIWHNIKPVCRKYNYNPPVSYIFADHLKNRGLSQNYLDAMALEYCKLKNNTFIAAVMPAALKKDNEIVKILNSYGTIVYRKNISVNSRGMVNLIKQMYANESWLGDWNNNFHGARYKASCCFQNQKNPMRIFLLECKNLETMIECKKEVRKLFKLKNHSVHTTDDHEESLDLARTFFVDNSIHFINNSEPKNFKNFHPYLDEYINWIKKNNIDVDDLCIDSGSVLAAYGLRDCGDIDYLHHGYNSIRPPSKNIESHNRSMGNHTKTKDEIIYDPENHFWYRGVKFASINVIKGLKEKGGGMQNKQDVISINKVLNK